LTVNGLKRIMGEFPQALDVVKPLCVRLRKILFPLDHDESMMIGTPAGDTDQLYIPIIAAFDEAISKLSPMMVRAVDHLVDCLSLHIRRCIVATQATMADARTG
jgi:hypothetical protein